MNMNKRDAYIEIKQEQAIKDGVVCVCKQVTERKIRKVVSEGRKRFISVKQATDAGSGCGLCQPIVQDIIDDQLKK
jgi:bacterioferritin-associated ferredoxin